LALADQELLILRQVVAIPYLAALPQPGVVVAVITVDHLSLKEPLADQVVAVDSLRRTQVVPVILHL
jgi:hypothetical protein